MATFEVWNKPDHGDTKPDHSLTADKFVVGERAIIFYSSENNVLHAVVPTPGLVVKKTG